VSAYVSAGSSSGGAKSCCCDGGGGGGGDVFLSASVPAFSPSIVDGDPGEVGLKRERTPAAPCRRRMFTNGSMVDENFTLAMNVDLTMNDIIRRWMLF
jgi:hypothetical protein